ncbi:glycosyltransferase [Sphingobacterium phlebotomi]|uniref:Glycosyltransferase n=1 Tax=Sphingobacterium phlebotomi TaxID=2605433 RepID=A0A5D4HBG4_9SPHI|nr:glycosyltransferase [Sphingobacterium phlebotomi]TYR36845.1 glycosyltransferase [Sphingobacterium phlebotomi]
MNIVILVKNLTSGGAEKQSVLLAKALANYYKIHYVILNAKYQEPKYLSLIRETETIKLIAFKGSLVSRFFQFCNYLKANEINCIFSYLTAANFYAILAARITGVKKVFTGIRNAYLPPLKMFIDRILCNRFATTTILNCYSGMIYFVQNGFKENKTIVISNCFENIIPFSQKVNTGKIKIISVGRFVKQKDYFTALKVIDFIKDSYPNIIYQIVGFGELETEIREKIQEMGLTQYVEIYINPNNIPNLLNEADIYLSTSLFEGTSNSLMEAINANLPIVATDVGDNNRLILAEETGSLTAVGDVEALSISLGKLISNEQRRNTFARRGKEHLLRNYSVEQFQENYKQLIEK